MDKQPHKDPQGNVVIDLGDPYIGMEVDVDAGIDNTAFDDSTESHDISQSNMTDKEDLDEDFTMFLDEIAGDKEIDIDTDINQTSPVLSSQLHTGLEDIVEGDTEDEEDDSEEEQKQNNVQSMNKINQNMNQSDDKPPDKKDNVRIEDNKGKQSPKLPKTTIFDARNKHQNRNRLFQGHTKSMDQPGGRFVGSQVKLGQRRSSMTPLGMSSLKSGFSNEPRKLSLPQISEMKDTNSVNSECDHTPHELFVQLDELCKSADDVYEWKEKARWIKFEENVEEGANRWGKPHVSSLSFHSLLDLRKCIEQGVVLLDLEENTMDSIASKITEELYNIEQLKPEQRGSIIKLLLHKHKHLEGWSLLKRRSTQLFSGIAGGMRRRSSVSVQPTSGIRRMSLFPSFKITDKATTRSPPVGRRASPPVGRRASSSKVPVTNGYTKDSHVQLDSVVVNSNGTKSDMSDDNNDEDDDEEPLPIIPMRDPAILKRIPEGSETVALLVGEVDDLEKPIAAFVRLSEGCNIDNITEVPLPVRFIFLLLGSSETCLDYKEIGRSLGSLMSNTDFRETVYHAKQRRDLLKGLSQFLDESIVLPRGGIDDEKVLMPLIDMAKQKEQELKEIAEAREEEQPLLPFDPFKRTKRPFGGLVNDIKFRFPLYWTDIKDGFNLQSLAAFFFMYFACLTPAITFGGLLSDKTDQWIGVSEMMFGSFILGVVHASIGGQPLMIIGGSAPLLVFEEALYQACKSFELDFLSFRVWVSTWNAIMTVIVIAIEGIFLVRYITGFTKEVFAMLIPLIFIIETFIKINKYFVKHPLAAEYPIIPEDSLKDIFHNTSTFLSHTTQTVQNTTGLINTSDIPTNLLDNAINSKIGQPNTALFSMILTLGTFFIAYKLRGFKQSEYLGRMARKLISDFGVPIAIAIMVMIDVLFEDTYTEKLNVPDGVTPTDASKRGWFINPMGHTKSLPLWAIFAAIIPGLLLFILLFMEVLVTSMIVNKKDRKLKKGPGYNIDMLLIGTFTIISGLFGFPYMSVPIVRCIAQIQALEVFSKSHAPGEKPKLEKVQEHRLVNFFVHLMIGLSTLLGPVLREIPIAVLFGVFLFMGVTALNSSVLFARVLLIFMPAKHHPNVGYVTKVRMWKMHLYTFLQLCCLGVLWAFKSTKAALGFPFVLIIMVPFRLFVVKFMFKEEELIELDSDTRQIISAKRKRLQELRKNLPALTSAL